MPPKLPRKTRKATNNSGSSSSTAESESVQRTCDGCKDTITKEEALNCSVCKVWLHCYCAGVPRRRFADILSTFVCIPCSLSLNNTVVTELRGEIAALKAEIVELRTALDSTNKKLETVSQGLNPSSPGEAGAEWTAVVKKNAKQRRRDRNPTSKPSSRLSSWQPNPSFSPSAHAANARPPASEDNQAAKVS